MPQVLNVSDALLSRITGMNVCVCMRERVGDTNIPQTQAKISNFSHTHTHTHTHNKLKIAGLSMVGSAVYFISRYSVCLLYWYKSTNTDAEGDACP